MNNLEILKALNLEIFTRDELTEIFKGVEKDLNILIYAKKEFNYSQMEQIRLGLESNVDVSIYAKPEMDLEIMNFIKEKLIPLRNKRKLNIRKSAENFKELSNEEQLTKIREGLK